MKKFLPALLSVGLLTQIAFAQTIDKNKLDMYFDTLEANNKFMGSVAVSQNGNIVYTKQVGYAAIENEMKSNVSTRYRIGSITKTFTAVLIFKAIEEKRISLSDRIDTYFPSIKNASKITIEHLLNHRSGIHNFTASIDYANWLKENKSTDEMVEIIEKGGSNFEPDTRAMYSNSNYVLLSIILERIYNMKYALILNERIITPLGLADTYYGGDIHVNNQEAFSYIFRNGWKKGTETNMSIPLGAGAIVSTPVDLTKFADALFNGRLVSASALEYMKTIKDNFGMGLSSFTFYDKVSFGHTGGIDAFTSTFSYFPEDRIAYAYTSNGTNYDNNKISIAVLSAIYGKPYEIPIFHFINLSSGELDVYTGVYSSKDMPVKLLISKTGNALFAQPGNQPAFKLDAIAIDKFIDPNGTVMEFNPTDKSITVKQSGRIILFTKE